MAPNPQHQHHYRYIRKDTPTGFVMTWTPALAGRHDMVECTRDGTPLRHIAPPPTAVIPKAVPATEPAPAKKPFVIPEGARVISFDEPVDPAPAPEPAAPEPAPAPVAAVPVPPTPTTTAPAPVLPATFEHMPKRALLELAASLGMPDESTATTNRNILKQRIQKFVEDKNKPPTGA